MFIDLFGKQYKRNPNLIDTNYTFTECTYLHNLICSGEFEETEFKHLVKPVLDKLSIYDNCFLQSELEFIKKFLDETLEKFYCEDYAILESKTKSYLTKENIQINRRKAELC